MSYLTVTKENIETEHICCAISNSTSDTRVTTKKEWLKKAFGDGLKFVKLNERGKVFIEYLPSEKAWVPIEADNYYYINCFWVSGKFVKQGHGSALLDICLGDAKKEKKDGLVVLSSKKKMPFLSDPIFLKKKGFMVADTRGYFELLYLPLNEKAVIPKFKNMVDLKIAQKGIVVYYSNQCPHTEMYVEIIKEMAIAKDVPFEAIRFNSYQEAQASPSPFTTYSFFDEGEFITNEIFGPKKFEKYLDNRK